MSRISHSDPAPLSMFESIAILRPEEEWRPGVDFDSLVAEMDASVRMAGVANMWSMPIKNRLDMLATGGKTPVGIKIFGPDVSTLEAIGQEIEGLLPTVRGTASVFAERVTGGRYLEVDLDRKAAAPYGLGMTDVQHTIMAAVGGMNVTRTVEGWERYSVNVRHARELRDEPEAIGRILVAAPLGAQIPLTQVANIRFAAGPPMIKSENGLLNSVVFVDVRDRDIGSYVGRRHRRDGPQADRGAHGRRHGVRDVAHAAGGSGPLLAVEGAGAQAGRGGAVTKP